MSNIFIFSNAFLTNTFIYEIDFLVNIKINKIILMKENHNLNKKYPTNIISKIEICDNIDQCILNSDYIFIIYDNLNLLPEKTINYIKNMSKQKGKVYYEIQNKHTLLGNELEKCFFYNLNAYKKYPTIINISIGCAAQQYCSEILLHKILSNNKINFKQFFSNSTLSILHQLQEKDILNKTIRNNINNNNKIEIVIYSFNIGINFSNIKKYIQLIRNINPDFVILQTNSNFESYDLIKNYIKYGGEANLDIILKSHYNIMLNTKDYDIIYCDKIINNADIKIPIYDIEDYNIERDLSFEIFSLLSLPQGINKIN